MPVDAIHHGACLCGAVKLEVSGSLPPPNACHCSQCRKQTGHYFASTDVARDALRVEGEENITWFQSSPRVRRGFCCHCGSTLFWDAEGRAKISIAMGAFDSPTHTRLNLHIFVADKGDYYDIDDGLPQNQQ